MAIKIRKKRTEEKPEVQETSDVVVPEVIIDENLDDQFVRTSVSVHGWVTEHARVILGILTVIVIGLVVYSVFNYIDEKEKIETSDDLLQAVYTTTMMTEEQATLQEANFGRNPGMENIKVQHRVPNDLVRHQAIDKHLKNFIATYPQTPLKPLAHLMLAGSEQYLGNAKPALDNYNEVQAKLSSMPNAPKHGNLDIFAMQGQAAALLDLGETEKALAKYDEIQKAYESYAPMALLSKAKIYEQLKQKAKAIATYREVEERFNNSQQSLFAKQRLLLLAEKLPEKTEGKKASN